MPYTVAVSFDKFLQTISLSGKHEETAEARRKHLVGLLEEEFTILNTIPTGSIVHGTGLVGAADLDIIAVLHYGKYIKGKTPRAVLESVRTALEGSSKIVKKNGQAVTLYYTTWPYVDIVPASQIDNQDGTVNYYEIPDMVRGTWLKTRPRKHNNLMATASTKQRSLIQMLKTWNRAHSEWMQSYHISMLVMSLPDVTNSWPYEVRYFFDQAVTTISSPLYHPKDGYAVDSYLDASARKEVRSRLLVTRDRARAAYDAIQQSDEEEAIRLYGLIFGKKFPVYG